MKRHRHKKEGMKSTGDRSLWTVSFVYRGLLFSLIILGIVLIAGTIYGVFFHSSPADHVQITVSQKSGQSRQGQTFTGIGRIRVSTSGSQRGMVIILVTFNYYPEDRAFSEELALRVKDFRKIIEDYFGAFSTVELQKKSEGSIKTDLLSRFNAILRLGQIEALFFSDFMIVG